MKKKIILNVLVILSILIISTTVLADDITGSMAGISATAGNSKIIASGQQILGIVQAIGIAVAVIMTVVIAIRYMMESAEGKGEIKNKLKPYIIGAVLLFAASSLLMIPFYIGSAINGMA